MAILKDVAQVLRVHEHGNSSLVLVLFGRRLGQLRVLAKGARRWPKKGFEGGFDLLVRGEALVYPRSGEALWILKEWEERARPAFRNQPAGPAAFLLAVSYLCELTEALSRETSNPLLESPGVSAPDAGIARTYDALARAADGLAEGLAPGAVLLPFSLSVLSSGGMLAGLEECSDCGRALLPAAPDKRLETSRSVWLDFSGLRCAACASAPCAAPARARVALNASALAALRFSARSGRPAGVNREAARALGRALPVLVQGALERDLRTLPAAAWLVARAV
jgi:recombinational DNA repair protein (RecF pathway)